ncbi:MAG TPA: bifunctional phosphopantothenoylcysteine decarboxylase/phosphopantothenate--cysteine ligase CoaBC [Candidatus Merdibacter merdigallinarum]|nr:bifunctional phosphopantothenoylcysteine decarboxylase/phosphopantothenate--cysteine ligase CoaBC [Candidatus Merdibacter merdigallinarum]
MQKTIVLGVTGGIAAFKAAQLASDLIKKDYDVEVILTKNATQFITPLTFEALIDHNVVVDTFEKVQNRSIHHISIAKKADLFILVPASANVIAKVAHGIADDMLTTTFLACNKQKVICPAMNTQMYENPITQENLQRCRDLGYAILEPAVGHLACGDTGKGKLCNLQDILDYVDRFFHRSDLLKGKRVLITAGPTQEALDPVRYLTNHSSGKMGYSLAQAALDMGAEVTLISGPVQLTAPKGVRFYPVTTAKEMFDAVCAHCDTADFIIKAAAVGDYRPLHVSEQKIKKDGERLHVEFVKNPDILAYLGEHKRPHQIICGFAMETQNLLENAQAKLENKHCDMIVANDLHTEGAGFQSDTNIATILDRSSRTPCPKMSKYALGVTILKHMLALRTQGEQ